jgi:hypothetical protein
MELSPHEKPAVAKPLKKFSALYGNRKVFYRVYETPLLSLS